MDISIYMTVLNTALDEGVKSVDYTVKDGLIEFPEMHALAKTGSIRTYKICIRDYGDHAVLTTQKRVTQKGVWTADDYEYWSGVNIGKSNETTYLEQAINNAKSIINKLKDAGFTEELPTGKFNTDANGKIKPMLATSFDEKRIKFPCIVQPKYDGVRCTISESSDSIDIISRKGKPYKIPHLEKWASTHKGLLPLDGELYNHGELTFQEIVSAVKKLSPLTDSIRYVVYDRPIDGVTNEYRWKKLVNDFSGFKDMPAYLSSYDICHNMDEVWACHKKYVAEGYEGAIIRNMDGLYEFGFRSNNLIKLKVFEDKEFEIVGVEEAAGRDAGTAIFVCKCKGGTFNVKPQGSRELRAKYFHQRRSLIGKKVTVQFQGLSDDGIPRFPSAVAIRDYE